MTYRHVDNIAKSEVGRIGPVSSLAVPLEVESIGFVLDGVRVEDAGLATRWVWNLDERRGYEVAVRVRTRLAKSRLSGPVICSIRHDNRFGRMIPFSLLCVSRCGLGWTRHPSDRGE